MKKAGCWMISFGIESGCQQVLDAVSKGISPEQSIQAVNLAKKAGLRVSGHFILGLPGDTYQSIKETIHFALGLDLDMAQFYCATPFPGALLYDQAIKQGWIRSDLLEDIGQNNAVLNLPGLDPARVNRFKSRAYKKFYLRPKQIVRTLSMVQPGMRIGFLREAIKFIRWAE